MKSKQKKKNLIARNKIDDNVKNKNKKKKKEITLP